MTTYNPPFFVANKSQDTSTTGEPTFAAGTYGQLDPSSTATGTLTFARYEGTTEHVWRIVPMPRSFEILKLAPVASQGFEIDDNSVHLYKELQALNGAEVTGDVGVNGNIESTGAIQSTSSIVSDGAATFRRTVTRTQSNILFTTAEPGLFDVSVLFTNGINSGAVSFRCLVRPGEIGEKQLLVSAIDEALAGTIFDFYQTLEEYQLHAVGLVGTTYNVSVGHLFVGH